MIQNFFGIALLLTAMIFGNVFSQKSIPLISDDPIGTQNQTRLCPSNEERPKHLWELYDNVTGNCYPPKSRGPCGSPCTIFDKIRFEDSEYGKCQCGEEYSRTKHLNRPLAPSSIDGNCYPLYDKANCKDGEWFVLESDDSSDRYQSADHVSVGVCHKNPCLHEDLKVSNESIDELTIMKFLGFEYYKSREDFKCSDLGHPYGDIHPLDLNKPFWFLYEDGKCYRTFTQGPCQDGQLVVFEGTDNSPRCFNLTGRETFPIPDIIEEQTGNGSSEELETSTTVPFSWLCPENGANFRNELDWVFYDNATEKCYKQFSQGPCNNGSFKYWSQLTKGSEIGICRNISPLNTFRKLNRPVAQSLKDGQLYLVYSQGDCNSEEWFVFNKNFDGVCKQNPCLNNSEILSENSEVNATELIKYLRYDHYGDYESFEKSDIEEFPQGHPLDIHKPFWFLHRGKCFKYSSRGPCDLGQVFVFKGLNPIPVCYDPNVDYGSIISGVRVRVPPAGSGYSHGGGGLTGTGDQKCEGQLHGDKCIPKPQLGFT